MGLIIGALIAGILTTLAPCVLPLLPIIVGGSLAPTESDAPRRNFFRAVVISGSLAGSVLVFSLLLKASQVLIKIPLETWAYISGGILILLGISQVFPQLWGTLDHRLKLGEGSQKLLRTGRSKQGTLGLILTGAALGPVFSSCSPLYAYIVATAIPASLPKALVLLVSYVVGLAGTLLLISIFGQKAISKLRWAANPKGAFRIVIGIIFILVGIAVVTGLDKEFQTWFIIHSEEWGVVGRWLTKLWGYDAKFIPEG